MGPAVGVQTEFRIRVGYPVTLLEPPDGRELFPDGVLHPHERGSEFVHIGARGHRTDFETGRDPHRRELRPRHSFRKLAPMVLHDDGHCGRSWRESRETGQGDVKHRV